MSVRGISREVIYAVLPVTLFTITLQVVLGLPVEVMVQFLIGATMVTAGLVLFLLGVHLGLLRVGESIGGALTRTGRVAVLIPVAVLLGLVVTVAEPDVRVLATQVDIVFGGAVPKHVLIAAVAVGVALWVGLAMVRIVLGYPLKYFLAVGYGLVFVLATFTPAEFLGVSLDAGGVTTGPMTVPFLIALGLGAVGSMGARSASTDGFGLIALASIGPILAVLLLGVVYG